MAMALPQDLAWKPSSSSSSCLLQTPVHQRLQNKGKKAENNNTSNNKIRYYCSKKREENKKSNNLVIVYCSSIGGGTLETFVEREGPPPKVKKKFFKDTERREKLWREFFLDPSQWWDGRPEKMSASYPDFTHKESQEGLWLDDRDKPSWVEAEVAAMAPGTVQLNRFSWNRKLQKHVKDGQPEMALQCFKEMQ